MCPVHRTTTQSIGYRSHQQLRRRSENSLRLVQMSDALNESKGKGRRIFDCPAGVHLSLINGTTTILYYYTFSWATYEILLKDEYTQYL